MAKKQTRKSVSLTKVFYVRMQEFSTAHHDIPLSKIADIGIQTVLDGRVPLTGTTSASSSISTPPTPRRIKVAAPPPEPPPPKHDGTEYGMAFFNAERRANTDHDAAMVSLPVPLYLASAVEDLIVRAHELRGVDLTESEVFEAGINRMLDRFETHGVEAVK